jgi:hypothetical protein
MPSIFRISQPGREPITDVDSVEMVEGAIGWKVAAFGDP